MKKINILFYEIFYTERYFNDRKNTSRLTMELPVIPKKRNKIFVDSQKCIRLQKKIADKIPEITKNKFVVIFFVHEKIETRQRIVFP